MAGEPTAANPSQVVIAGGGFAGLEALLALRELAGERVAVTLVAPEPDFVYKPFAVEEPFLSGIAEQRALEPIAEEFGARFIQQALARVAADEHAVELTDGSRLPYDFLIVCVGPRPRPALRDAITFRIAGEPLRIDELLSAAEAAEEKTIAFVIPSAAAWPLPIYELALMARRRAEDRGLRDVRCAVVTPEPAPLAAFGPLASEAVANLLRVRGVEVHTAARVSEEGGGELCLHPGERRLHAAAIVALPALEGPQIPGLPADEHGFIPIDDHGRVRGLEDVYAAGDATNFPIKHGGLASQQADAAAEHVAARVGAPVDPQPFRPVMRGKLLAGDESLSLSKDLAGGAREGIASQDYLWWPPHKVSARYLSAWLGHEERFEPEPPLRPLEVEVELPREWHAEPMLPDPDRASPEGGT